MKYIILFCIPFIFFSQGIEEKLKPFTEVQLDIDAITYIEFGNEHSVQIDGRKKALKKIDIEVRGGTLVIEKKRSEGFFSFFNSTDAKDIKIKIIMKKLNYLELNGSGETNIEDITNEETTLVINGANDVFTGGSIDRLKIDIKGAGNVELENLFTKQFDLDIKGAGDLYVSGSTEEFDIHIKGAGDVKAYSFKTRILRSKIYGAGDVRIFVEEEIDASIYGAGSITYKGNPKRINDKIYGAGEIQKY